MDIIKIIGIGLIAVIIIIILKQYKPEFAMYASLVAGMLIFALIATKLSGIIEVLAILRQHHKGFCRANQRKAAHPL